MKIFGIGRNYVEHIKELENDRPDEPVVFLMPDTALLKNNAPFYYPAFSKEVHHEIEIVIRISKEGKNIDEKFAHKYYDQLGLGIDFTARDIQQRNKPKSLPWAIPKGFDSSAPISELMPVSQFPNMQDINFQLQVNGETRQVGNTSLMIFEFNFLVAYLSQFFTLKTGDLIYSGTPKGVGPVKVGDRLTASIENKTLLDFEVK